MKKRMHFRVSHRDKAERAIITAGRSVGATVHQVNGKDLPDLLVGYKGVTYIPEVKSRLEHEGKDGYTRKTTTRVRKGQKTFAEEWRGGPTGIVYEPADLLWMIGAPQMHGRWLAENGAFLCESCWLPENGLHAKDCPTRLALKRPPKVEMAHRAAKKAREVLPKRGPENMEKKHTFTPIPGLPMAPDWMQKAIEEHHEELKKAKTCAMGPCQRERVANEQYCDIHVGGIILVDLEEDEPRPPLTLAGLQAAAKRIHEPRGVEGELQPIRQCVCRHAPSSHGRLHGEPEKGVCWASECPCMEFIQRGSANLPRAPNGA